ncbi:MAG: glycosyltransferase family 2 protein [Thermoproteus sp.]
MYDQFDKLISLVIPIRNESNEVISTLCQSLKMQKFKDLYEVIIVDESDDEHLIYILSCIDALQKERIHVKFLHKSFQGVGHATLEGLKLANGMYVIFLDSDNLISTDFIETLVNTLRKEKDLNILAFVSFLSRTSYQFSLSNKPFLIARLYLSTFFKGLIYNRNIGFINILRMWNRRFLLEVVGTDIKSPLLSYQDQPKFWFKVFEGLKKGWKYRHIDKVLIEDIRHNIEDYNYRFICRRMKWYVKGAMTALANHEITAYTLMTLALPVALILVFLAIIINFKLTITVSATLYSILFILLCKVRRLPILTTNTLKAFVFIPVLLLIESLCGLLAIVEVAVMQRIKI